MEIGKSSLEEPWPAGTGGPSNGTRYRPQSFGTWDSGLGINFSIWDELRENLFLCAALLRCGRCSGAYVYTIFQILR